MMLYKTLYWQTSCLVCLCLLLSGYEGVNGSLHNKYNRKNENYNNIFGFSPNMLFVFGDSYVDGGNNPIKTASSWKFPYGITFPGKPTGRYSDGRVSSDYFAKYIGLRSPIPYRWRRYQPQHLKHGMNFAYGGAGVFETVYKVPNTTLQIDDFRNLVHENVYPVADLTSSVALVSISGNDYFTYLTLNNVTQQGLETFTTRVIKQLVTDVERVKNLGVRKVAVAAIEPMGCLPAASAAAADGGTKRCNKTLNAIAKFHNTLLNQTVMKLNNDTKDTPFVLLDLYKAFSTVLESKGVPGISNFTNPMETCCVPREKGYSCGGIDKNGVKMFQLCSDPKSFFFWDNFHPSQEGWRSIYSLLLPGFRY